VQAIHCDIHEAMGRHSTRRTHGASYGNSPAPNGCKAFATQQRMIDETVADIDRRVPGTAAKLEHVEAATPRSFEFYTQHAAGTSFGTKFEGLPFSMNLSQEIEGLYHAGSVGIIMSGWLGAANYGAITANKVDAHLATLAGAR
jgi:phytoene dehydrogenase-like protein